MNEAVERKNEVVERSKLKYGLFSEVISCHGRSAQNNVRVRARNVPRVHGHKRLDDDASLASLSLQESDGVVFWMRRVAVLLKLKKLILGQPTHILHGL